MSILTALLFAYASSQSPVTRFAVIGDYGFASQPESDVAQLVRSLNPDFVITTGDNNYDLGAASTIDPNIGQYYHDYIFPYQGTYGPGATANKFFPCLGNHDWETAGATPYLNYFGLPGNERYYEFSTGSVRFFAVDSDTREPDGTSSGSVQGQWLQSRMTAATERWKIVYFHHAPYSSGSDHGSSTYMRWPFQAWGASVVLAGHDHDYERLSVNGMPYFVNGLGGRSIYAFAPALPETQFRYNGDYGAMIVDASDISIVFKFYNRSSTLIDSYTLNYTPPSVPNAPTSLKIKSAKRKLMLTWVQSSTAGVTQNRVYRSNNSSGPFSPIVTISATTSYTDSNLTSGLTYYYHVTAIGSGGESGFSNQASGTPK